MLKDSLVAPQQVGDSHAKLERGQIDADFSSMINIPPLASDDWCLVTAQGRIELADEGFHSSLKSFGLTIEDKHLLPESADLRTAWLGALKQVLESGEGQFFALAQHPRLASVGIAPLLGGRFVAIGLPRDRMCSPECLRSYARLISLTPRETKVLDLLVQGHTPASVADELSTRESTVRTQIKSILAKSSQQSMRALLVTLACLPSLSAVALERSTHRNRLPASV